MRTKLIRSTTPKYYNYRATFFAAMDLEGMHLGDPKTAPTFIKKIFKDFRAILAKKHVVQKFEKCDFEPIRKRKMSKSL